PKTNTSMTLNMAIEVHLDFGSLESASGYLGLIEAEKIIDIISYQSATLIGAAIYRLEGVVRGLNGTAFAPAINANCQIIILDDAGVSANLGRELWAQILEWHFATPSSPNVEIVATNFEGIAALPWSPCHLRAKRDGASIIISYVARENGNYDNWEMPSPLQAGASYKIEILNQNNQIIRTINNSSESFNYVDEMADFGASQAQLSLKIAQFAADGRLGHANHSTIAIV
ncbi:MAG: hypothetical protein AAB680_01445, partial [Pseudomonadota bacterium]